MEKAGQVTAFAQRHLTAVFTGLVFDSTVSFSSQANALFGLLGFGGGMDFDSDKAYRCYGAKY